MDLHDEEPAAAYETLTPAALVDRIAERIPDGDRVLVLVDGRSAGGKSTIADAIAERTAGHVVHTDDIAWNESPTDWDHLLTEGVIDPWRKGNQVDFRPPAWERREREGSVTVPEGTRVLVVEGVGAARESLGSGADLRIWVQSDRGLARERGIARDASYGTRTLEEAEDFWDQWMKAEEPFLAEDRPWTRADVIVLGTPDPGSAGIADGPL